MFYDVESFLAGGGFRIIWGSDCCWFVVINEEGLLILGWLDFDCIYTVSVSSKFIIKLFSLLKLILL